MTSSSDVKPLDPFTAINMACIAHLDPKDAQTQWHDTETALAAIPGGQGWTLAGGWKPVQADAFRAFVAVSRDRSVYAVAIRGALNLCEPKAF